MAVAHQVRFRHIATVLGQRFLLQVGFTDVHLENFEAAVLLKELPKLLTSVLYIHKAPMPTK